MRFHLWPRPRGGSGHRSARGDGSTADGQLSAAGRAAKGALVATATFLLGAGLPLAQAAGTNEEASIDDLAIRINFQPQGTEPACGYTPDHGELFEERDDLAFGWNVDHTDSTAERDGNEDQRLDTLAGFHVDGKWEIEVDNGDHEVRVGVGDASEASVNTLNVEGESFFEDAQLAAGRFLEITEAVTVTDGKLTLDQGAASEGATRINFIEIDARSLPEECEAESAPVEVAAASPTPTPSPTEPPDEEPPTPPIRINFQSKGSPEACGYTPDVGRRFAARNALAYGWNIRHLNVAGDRGWRRDQRRDTLIPIKSGGVWEIALPTGEHRVKVSVGDARWASTNTINVEGVNFFDQLDLPKDAFRAKGKTVAVDDGRLSIDAVNSAHRKTKINYVDINVFEPRNCADGPVTGDSNSSSSLPPRPYGLAGLKKVFGRRCNGKANDARAYFPSAGGRGKYGYVYYHSRMAKVVGHTILNRIKRKAKANDYGVWGYACRMKTGGSSWSVHSWGAAIDTNTLRNPFGQRRWNGRGSNGKPYRRFLPKIWMGRGFYWGLNFNDPMHFQYVSGY